MGFYGGFIGCYGMYPLVMTVTAIEAMAQSKVREFSHCHSRVIFLFGMSRLARGYDFWDNLWNIRGEMEPRRSGAAMFGGRQSIQNPWPKDFSQEETKKLNGPKFMS